MRSKYLPEVPSTYFLWAISYDSLHQKRSRRNLLPSLSRFLRRQIPDQEWQARQRLKVLENR